LQYAPTFHTPHFLPNGWSAPPPPAAETIPTYPFRVARTRNKPNDAVGFLPVYTKHRYVCEKKKKKKKKKKKERHTHLNVCLFVLFCFVLLVSHTHTHTHIYIPLDKFSKDGTKITTRIKQVSGDRNVFLQELQTLLPSTAIRVRTGGTIEMNGNVARVVRQWLAGLGF
jgi:hypothetical protein